MKRFRDSNYYVYPDGRLYSSKTKVFIRAFDNGTGYFTYGVCLGDRGKKKKMRLYVHRMVAECYLPNPQNLPQVNHKNCNRSDNRVENLEWISAKDNNLHSIVHGSLKFDVNSRLQVKRVRRVVEKKPKSPRKERVIVNRLSAEIEAEIIEYLESGGKISEAKKKHGLAEHCFIYGTGPYLGNGKVGADVVKDRILKNKERTRIKKEAYSKLKEESLNEALSLISSKRESELLSAIKEIEIYV